MCDHIRILLVFVVVQVFELGNSSSTSKGVANEDAKTIKTKYNLVLIGWFSKLKN